jgi:(1->4)-alpha-D-glucan 1-alpha-D-glucosylmutase
MRVISAAGGSANLGGGPPQEETALPPPRLPRATYRLQFNKDFTLADAEALVPYLARLGISHIYASPLLKARPGSMHGYDIVDHGALNPEIGGERDLARLVGVLADHGMGIVLDFVPNHMAVGGADNRWWLDVLEWGQESPYAAYFDIDWQAPRPELRDKVLLPFLGDHYGAILERGELVPRFDPGQGSFSVWYWSHRLPIHPADYASLIQPAVDELRDASVGDALVDILQAARGLAARRGGPGSRGRVARRRLAAEVKRRLADLHAAHVAIGRTMARLATDIPALHRLLERQTYRISFWRTAADEVNYRRFFDINDLAGLRMEDPGLFELTHRKVMAMLQAGQIQGLRIDHIDGLYNPAQYCRRLQAAARQALDRPDEDQPLWLVVEKILAVHERVRRDWPVAGTTGYDFGNQVLGLLVDRAAEPAFDRLYAEIIGHQADFEAKVHAAKRQIMAELITSELNVLASEVARLAATHWQSRDFTVGTLSAALAELVAWFPVYRTYVTPARITDLDRRYIHWAVARARKQAPDIDSAVFDFLRDILDTRAARGINPPYDRAAVIDFAMSLQQYTGPVMAKGFEDTALYRYNRFLALNEVGGDPKRFGLSPGSFHQAMRRRRRHAPHAMLATATHDSKRGEDVRARLAALSEMPEAWGRQVERWRRLNAVFRQSLDSGPAPEANDEYFLYQTLLGAWPMEGPPDEEFLDRLTAALVKSWREAKQRTSWHRPDPAYEAAGVAFLRRLLETDRHNPFLEEFLPFQHRLARLGMVNSLTQTVVKATAPGVPDFYQGSELWQLALVDPDNRRPVDWRRRQTALAEAERANLAELLHSWPDGRLKLAVIRALLAHRRDDPHIYAEGSYQPLVVRGEHRAHVLSYARCHGGRAVVVAVPRLLGGLWPEDRSLPPLGEAWRGVFIEPPAGLNGVRFRHLFTGEQVPPVSRRGQPMLPGEAVFTALPVAVLLGE